MFKFSVLCGMVLLCTSPTRNCYSVAMQTFAGTNTISYPVGVFDINGTLLGNATTAAAYISLWNNDTANARVGALALGRDSMHFNLNLNTGQSIISGVIGLRYFQADLPYTQFDAVRWSNGAYIDFGDGTGIRMRARPQDSTALLPTNTTKVPYNDNRFTGTSYYYIHTYPDSSLKTITFYHNDGIEDASFDTANSPASSLIRLRNLRGNLPLHSDAVGGSSYQQASMTNLQGIFNFSQLTSVVGFNMNCGDYGINACENIGYPQDFMANNKGLTSLITFFGNVTGHHIYGVRDSSFKISRLKSDWNTYFTQLDTLWIAERDWNREDLSALTHLTYFALTASDADGGAEPGGPYTPLDSAEVDSVYIQIARGAGQSTRPGQIAIATEGAGRTHASDAAVSYLLSQGWALGLDGVLLTQ